MKKDEAHYFLRSPFLTLVIVLFAAYLPVTSFAFAIKNDFFTSYYPAKFFVTESLRAGEFPLWNPFINFGYPMYGDLSLAYWNLSTWLFAIINYNAYSFTLEIIFYLLLAGAAMYKLTGIWISNKEYRLTAAISYMCSGYMIGHLQHFNWINAAGILPLLVYSIWKLLNTYDTKYIFSSIFLFSYFFTAVHPGQIIAVVYFLTGAIIFHLHLNGISKQTALRLTYTLIGITVVLTGPALAILDVLPLTNRHGPVNSDQILGVTDPGSWISFLLPFATTSDTSFLTNDIALRNCYIGLIPLAIFPIALGKPKSSLTFFFYIVIAFFLLISTSWASIIYKNLPLINTVRLPGEFRLIALFVLILMSAITLEQKTIAPQKLANAFKMLTWFFGIITILAVFHIIASRDSVIFDKSAFTAASFRTSLKNLINSLSFADKVIIQSVFQFILSRLYCRLFKGSSNLSLARLATFEFIFISLLNIPYTGIGQKSIEDIQSLINKSPDGILKPYVNSEIEVIKSYPYTDPTINNWAFYSKYPATGELMQYPLVLDNSTGYFSSGMHQKMLSKPFVFLNGSGTVIPTKNSYRSYVFSLDTKTDDTLTIKQVVFPGWKALIDGKPTKILHNSMLISLHVPSGQHRIDIHFENKIITLLLYTHLIIMMILGFYLLHHRIRYILP